MTRIRTAPVALLVASLLTPAGVASSEPRPPATGGGALAQTTSAIAQPRFLPSLAALPDVAPTSPPREIPRGDFEGGPVTGVAPEVSGAPERIPTPPTRSSFDTAWRNHAGITSPFFPPDPIGDVGRNHYVQAINTSVAVYEKSDPSGTPVAGPTALGTFFAPLGAPCTGNDGDPVVLYDQMADRFLVAQFADGPNRICVAVSTSSNPTGSWSMFAFPTSQFPDYFKIGAWPDAYYVTWNQGSVGVAALERSEMLTGSPAEIVTTSVAGHLGANMMLPADADGATPPPLGAPGLIYHHKDAAIAGGSDRIELRTVTPTFNGSPSTISVSAPAAVAVDAFDGNFCGGTEFVACITQPGTAQKLDPIMEWPMWRLQYRNFGTHESLVGNFLTDVDGTDRAGIRWFELRRTPPATAGAWSVHQQGTHSPDATHRWMGSVAMDGDGNVALGYSASDSTSIFPSVRYAGRLASDTLGTLPQGEFELFAGNSSQTASLRWGDYASMNVDPVDDCTFWFTGQYSASSPGQETRIGAFSFEPSLGIELTGTGNGTVTSSPGGISCATDCGECYEEGETVTLTATSAPDGTFFAGWSGGGCSGTGTCEVTVNETTFVTATFTDAAKTLTVTTSGSGSGTVTSSPAGISCPLTCTAPFATGSSVTLTPTPAPGSVFTGWSGNCSGAGGCSVVMDEDRAVDARFEVMGELATCSGEPVTHFGTPGDDVITGTPGDDVVLAGDGNDVIDALGGDDLVCAEGGDDVVKTEGGKDTVFGGPGNDTIRGGSGKDTLLGQGGKDKLLGQGGKDLLKGGGGRDTLKGGSGNDRLRGQGGNDNLRGQGGNDNLNGGPGIDTCRQGGGTGPLRSCEK